MAFGGNFCNLVGVNVLAPIGMLYGLVMNARNALYDRGARRSYSLGARTISIGNITAGGTGKTPLVALTARILAERGEKVCVLTRGYGRADERDRVLVSDGESILADAPTGGDEPVELARKLIGKAAVIADADRVGAAKWAKERFGVTAFVLDDGFQHRRAKRDIDIVCIDATDPCGNGRILPAGTLREPFNGLRRADIIVITRTNLVESTEQLAERLGKLNPKAAIFGAATRISGITKLEDFAAGRAAPDDDENRQFTAAPMVFSGIGNPESFRKQLETENFRLTGFRSFRDHHRYTQRDIDRLEVEAESLAARSLMTTAKDAVKLDGLRTGMPIFVLETEVAMSEEERFQRLIVVGNDPG